MEPLLTITRAGARETVASPRYHHRLGTANRPRVIVQWTRSGYGIYEDQDGAREVSPETAFVIIAPESAQYYYPREAKEPWVIDWVDFAGPLALSLFGGFRAQFGPVVRLRQKGLTAIYFHRLIASVLDPKPRDRWEISREAYAFLSEWWRESLHGDDEAKIIETVVSLCESTAYRLMTIKELAAECGMSREHFTRCFVRQVGTSPAVWLRQRRLSAAATLLKEDPPLSLSSIARETGFATGRHLMAAFRRAYGIRPRSTVGNKPCAVSGSPALAESVGVDPHQH